MTTICLIPGDGVGREVVPAAAQALATALPTARFITVQAGWDCYVRCGNALPDDTLRAVKIADATLFGATQSPTTGASSERSSERNPLRRDALSSGRPAVYRSPILALRKQLDLYANLRPAAPLTPRGRPIDLLVVRENTEGLYSGRERRDGDTAIAERVITRAASERIARTAFEQARRRAVARETPRPAKVTIVHKANVLKITDGLFRECCLGVAKQYPDVEVDELLVDAAAMWLVREPSRFDVIVTTNLFGDILSDLAAGLVGGLGIAASANVGAGKAAVFEPVHGSAPDIVGRGVANPIAAMLSAAMLLEHVGQPGAAVALRQAVRATVKGGLTTPDLGGMATTGQVTAAVCDILRAMAARGEFTIAPAQTTRRSIAGLPSSAG